MLSLTMPLSVSRRLLEEYNNNNDNKDNSQVPTLSSSLQSCSSSRSESPEPTFDSILSGHSLHRRPTFSYIPIHKRRTFSRPMSFNSMTMTMSIPNQQSSLTSTTSNLSLSSSIQTTPESETPTTPTSLCSSSSDQSMEYTSFPNLEKFADECWTEVRVEKKDNICDMEMESYDEMLVGGVRFQYS